MADDPLAPFFESYYRLRPVNATFSGIHAHDHRLPDWSPEGLEGAAAEMRALRRAVQPRVAGGPPDAWAGMDLRLADAFLEIQVAEIEDDGFQRRNPSLFVAEAIFGVLSLVTREFAPFDARLAAVTGRLRAIPAFLEGARRTLGSTAIPREWTARALRECEGATLFLKGGLDLWLAHESARSASATIALDEPDPLRTIRTTLAMCTCTANGAAREAQVAAGAARAAVTGFADWLRRDAPAAGSASRVACGADFFDLLLRRGHACQESRADLLAEAREEFDRLAAQFDQDARRAAPGGWPEIQERLAADHPGVGDYLSTFEDTWHACRDLAVARDLVTWPDAPIRFVSIPVWTREAAPYLYYLFYRSPAPFDPPAVHECTVSPVDSMMPADECDRVLRAINRSVIKLNYVVHHAGLGHHVQNDRARRSPSRIGQVAAVDGASRIGMFCGGTMAEGWACYAADLMEECGVLTPLERLSEAHGRLRQLARAIVDIELHQATMTLEQASAFYAGRVQVPPAAARAEACKNSMFPGAAIMYWLGTRAIHRLRRQLQALEGPAFSLRRFHDRLLAHGSVPVEMVAHRLRAEPSPTREKAM